MRNHQTYSLTAILNQNQIQPQLYEQILHDIKSPLEEISLVMTDDHSISVDKPPKRPNIPPPPIKSPINHLLDNNSNNNRSLFMINQKQSYLKTQQNFINHAAQSIVSPLNQQITTKNQNSQEKPWYQPFCGGAFQSFLHEDKQLELQLPIKTKIYKRRPIFDNAVILNIKQYAANAVKPTKSIQQAIRILNSINQPEIATFLQLLKQLSKQLQVLSKYKQRLYNYLQIIYEKLSQNTQYLPQRTENILITSRVFRRLKSKNTTQVIAKVLKRKKQNKEAEYAIEQLFTCLNHIEQIISNYLKDRPNAVDFLSQTYAFIQFNYQDQPTLSDQIRKLLSSLQINLFLDHLNIIWDQCDERLLNERQFIESVTLNDLVIRSSYKFQQDLILKGFSRNQ